MSRKYTPVKIPLVHTVKVDLTINYFLTSPSLFQSLDRYYLWPYVQSLEAGGAFRATPQMVIPNPEKKTLRM